MRKNTEIYTVSEIMSRYMLPRLNNKTFFSLSGWIFAIFAIFSTISSLIFGGGTSVAMRFSGILTTLGLGLVISLFLPLIFIPIGLLHRSSIIPIRLDGLSPLYYNLDPLPTNGDTNTTADTGQPVGSERNPEQLITQAEPLTVDMSTVGDKIALDDAIDDLSEALRYYRAAADKVDDPDREAEIETTVTTLRENRNKLKRELESQTTLNEALHTGEESFQEAIRAYVTDEKTLSRIRFRQARDRFEEANNTVEESDMELLSTPVTVDVTTDRELPTTQLSDLHGFDSKTAAMLESEGITTVSDLTDGGGETIVSDEITELSADDGLSEAVITKLTLLSWLHTKDTFEFSTGQDISGRYKQAKRGFEEC
ncbi:hypothetical protein [Halonotius roseus]|uniref:Uncharacterized protein n=1 Tax=Halonotius roseus TaxID=2511997 RepID=A0A544QM14_9EURY|nr:hypothetical protein [Halonotius roseus]TQQ79630.1 hypothetical protein EWF95_11520 [Halonotius roseus]